MKYIIISLLLLSGCTINRDCVLNKWYEDPALEKRVEALEEKQNKYSVWDNIKISTENFNSCDDTKSDLIYKREK